MSTDQFRYLSELVDDIRATDDSAIAAVACRALNELLQSDLTGGREKIEA
jgi:hypothetical protein